MAMSMMDFLNMSVEICSDPNMTKERFGEIMHDINISEDKKQEYLAKVKTYGGYANLAGKKEED